MELIALDAAATALLVGVLAAFNPCGFALLPAYITVIVTGNINETVSRPQAIARAISFGTAMTVGFMAVFISFGLIFSGLNVAAQGNILPYVPYVTVVFGLLLIGLGIHLLRGGEFNVPGMKISGTAPTKAFASQIMYGVGFALASLSCTIGPFLGVVAVALDAPNAFAAGLPFVVYAIGMGTSVLVVSLIAAVAGSTVVAGLRKHMGTLMKVTSVVMLLVGIYVTIYGIAEALLLNGNRALEPFLVATGEAQSTVVRAIFNLGPTALTIVAVLVVGGSLGLWLWSRATEARAKKTETPVS